MSSEQAMLAEAHCRTVTYASKKDMSEQQLRTFINRTAEQSVKEMENNPSLSAGAAGNEVLDDLEFRDIRSARWEGSRPVQSLAVN